MDHRDHYAEAFSPMPGRCFRMVSCPAQGAQGAPRHRPDPVAVRGTFRDGNGHRWRCEACSSHAGPLVDCCPILAYP